VRPVVLAVLGKIGSGKSTVGGMLARRGAALLRADDASRAVLAAGEPLAKQVLEAFGAEYARPEGTLDRPRLAERIFRDAAACARLEGLTHPAIVQWLRARVEELWAQQPAPPLIGLEALFLPAHLGADELADTVAVCRAPYEMRLQRLLARDGVSEEQARARLDRQEAQDRDPGAPDFVIDTGGDLAETEEQVAALWQELAGRCSTRRGA